MKEVKTVVKTVEPALLACLERAQLKYITISKHVHKLDETLLTEKKQT